ncbi:hypothetical protein Ahy_A03g011072 isoform I [Arachis hypogaea]|uniref:Uncharacterized protein n=1 Tax=Arachis hypogaea TaxID=3818 RepID=A0A445DPH2_ARAHY|nr:hypothetical protein Ahy_A03g011072 isoform I [Arachis hypogaea]
MADPASSPAVTLEPKPQHTESQPDPAPPSTSLSQSPAPANPNPNPTLLSAPPPAPPLQQHHPTFSYVPPQVSAGPPFAPPAAPSFRPLPPQAPHFSPLPNPSGGAAPPSLAYQNPSIPPPGVSSAAAMAPGVASSAGGVAVPVSVPHMQPMMSYQVPPGQPAIPTLRPPYAMPNGYAAIPGAPQTGVPPAGWEASYCLQTYIYNSTTRLNLKSTMFATECTLALCAKLVIVGCAAISIMLLMCGNSIPLFLSHFSTYILSVVLIRL